MILVTGATGTVGLQLLPQLLERDEDVRVMVRDPRGLGRLRVEVRLVLGDLIELSDQRLLRQALRGVDTVIHLAATIRDQHEATVEELNGLATARLLAAAEQRGVGRFVFFSALNATEFQRTRFFRAKALAERAVAASPLETTIFAPSIVYDRDDPWVTIQRRLALLPAIPISGAGKGGVRADLGRRRRRVHGRGARPRSLERQHALRARRAGAAHLRGHRAADRARLGPRAPARSRSRWRSFTPVSSASAARSATPRSRPGRRRS